MATSDIALERVQALLKVDTGNGSLHNHLVKIARAMASEKPDKALAEVENLSWSLKKAGFRGATGPDQEQDIVADAAAERKRQQWCNDAMRLVRPPSDPLCAPKVLAAVQNVMEDARMFEWAGVGFGKQEWYHISMSLRKLAADTDRLDKLRLWGKILGTDADYYVAEGTLKLSADEAPEMALPGTPEFDVEPRGEGANIASYWVSTGGAAPWVRLPAARASHIVAARKIKHMITGDLGRPVHSMPWFPGKERHLLRAQIARITSTCTLAPDGYYALNEEDENKKLQLDVQFEGEDQPPAAPAPDALKTAEGWVHVSPALLSIGKCYWPELPEADEEIDELVAAKEEDVANREKVKKAIKDTNVQKDTEPPTAILTSIKEDKVGEVPEEGDDALPQAWNIKVYGDKGKYAFESGEKTYRITAVRSLIWPGAITVAQGNRFANLYVGYGLKCATLVPAAVDGKPLQGALPFSSGCINPMGPEDVCDEPKDLPEEKEPQPEIQDEASDGEDMDQQDEA